MNNFKNWKTTICGILVFAGGLWLFHIGRDAEGAICIPMALGLLVAKDHTTAGVGDDAVTLHEINEFKKQNT